MKKCCETCKYFFEDSSVGVTDCTNEFIEEDDIEKYYTNGEEGCPCWVAKYSEEEIAAEEAYFQKLSEASRSYLEGELPKDSLPEDIFQYAKSDVEAMIELYQSSTKEDKDEQ